MSGLYANEAPVYEAKGFYPRPAKPETKECRIKGWTTPNDKLMPGRTQEWLARYGSWGIGLLLGSPFPDGTRLAALDIDRDAYVPLGKAVLRDPPCARFGSKGMVYFVRAHEVLSTTRFRVGGKKGEQVAEFLFARAFCVLPPTMHPRTGQPYQWIGTPLLEIDFRALPLIAE